MARCVIVSACPVSPALAGLLRAEDYLIACDAGYCNCEALGRQPDAVVGDFDSAPRPRTHPGEALVVLPHVKDDTDTEYAAQLAARGVQTLLQAIHYKHPPVYETIDFALLEHESVSSVEPQ